MVFLERFHSSLALCQTAASEDQSPGLPSRGSTCVKIVMGNDEDCSPWALRTNSRPFRLLAPDVSHCRPNPINRRQIRPHHRHPKILSGPPDLHAPLLGQPFPRPDLHRLPDLRHPLHQPNPPRLLPIPTHHPPTTSPRRPTQTATPRQYEVATWREGGAPHGNAVVCVLT